MVSPDLQIHRRLLPPGAPRSRDSDHRVGTSGARSAQTRLQRSSARRREPAAASRVRLLEGARRQSRQHLRAAL